MVIARVRWFVIIMRGQFVIIARRQVAIIARRQFAIIVRDRVKRGAKVFRDTFVSIIHALLKSENLFGDLIKKARGIGGVSSEGDKIISTGN